MKKPVLIMIVAFAAAVTTAFGQDKLKMEVGYSISTPLGSFKNNFIRNTSFRGMTGEVSYPVNSHFSVGLNLGYQSYYQKYGRELYKTGTNETTSAVVTNTMDIMPVMLRGTYFPKGGSATIQPFVSIGAGVNMVNYSQYFGQFGENQVSVPFAAQAGGGIAIPVGSKYNRSAIKLGATYNFSAYNKNNISNISAIGASAGVMFRL